MGKRKPVSLLKRQSHSNPGDASLLSKKAKKKLKADNPDAFPQPQNNKPRVWNPINETHRQAAHAVGRLLNADATGRDGVSLKSLTLAPHINNKKAVYAVTIETLKHVPVLEQLVERANVLAAAAGLTSPVAYVLIRELLWGSEELQPLGPAEKAILSLETPLKEALESILTEANTIDVHELLPAVKLAAAAAERPRTARVNQLKISIEDALEILRNPPSSYQHSSNSKKWAKITAAVSVDKHLPELLVFPAGADLHDHPLVLEGSLILQSKASCMPARALDPQPGWQIVDACAAPGNKTTHLAALVSRTGEKSSNITNNKLVIAFDKDPTRLKRLQENADRAGAGGIIEARRGDFLAVNPTEADFKNVSAVLLDPSCSGSGTVFSRMDHLLPSAASKAVGAEAVAYKDERVVALANFQTTALRHALTFPAVKRVVYSTCSLHAEENEKVVAGVLEDAQSKGFELITALPAWPRRGEPGWGLSDDDAAKLVRTDPLEDGTDGFFVALFERKTIEKKEKIKREKKKKNKEI
jgi:25S rRNA (cytosine2278-C5)-methyltransferase